MPTFRSAPQAYGEYDGSSGSSVTRQITALAGDTLVLAVGIDWTWPTTPDLPEPTSPGVTFSPRTTRVLDTQDRGFVAVWTGAVTADNPSITYASGGRDATVNGGIYVLPGGWTFVGAAATGTQAAATSCPAPSVPGEGGLSPAAGDTLICGWQSEYQGTGAFTPPAPMASQAVSSLVGAGSGGFTAAWEDLASAGATGTRIASHTNNPWSAISIVMRPPGGGGPAPSYPQLVGTASNLTTTNTLSHPITLPTGIVAGELLEVVFSSDGAPTCSADSASQARGWQKLGQASNSTVVTGAVFQKIATGDDALTVTTSVTEMSSHISARVANGGLATGVAANGSSTNSDPPSHTPPAAGDYLWLTTRSGDSTVAATAAPSGYSGLVTRAHTSTGGASTNIAVRTVSGSAAENPGPFASASEQWVCWTLAIPYAAPAAATVPPGQFLPFF